jgi:hypothetical protein
VDLRPGLVAAICMSVAAPSLQDRNNPAPDYQSLASLLFTLARQVPSLVLLPTSHESNLYFGIVFVEQTLAGGNTT